MKNHNVVLRPVRAVLSRSVGMLHGLATFPADAFWAVFTKCIGTGKYPPIKDANATISTSVEEYWTQHTVNSPGFKSAYQSRKYLEQLYRGKYAGVSGVYHLHKSSA